MADPAFQHRHEYLSGYAALDLPVPPLRTSVVDTGGMDFGHNTGAHQFGYRYILDAIIPLLALLAAALGQKIRWHFVLLLLISIAFNIYGAYWFING
jgi:hypothetical protein